MAFFAGLLKLLKTGIESLLQHTHTHTNMTKYVEWLWEKENISFMALCKLFFITDHYVCKLE
jgi:hypothetical protein